jgi:small-conductance mechanosensitive channel
MNSPSATIDKWAPRVLGAFVLSLISLAPVLAGAAGEEAADPETVSQFAKMIRWSGVLTSVFVIAAAWLLLRFVRNLVEKLSTQFANRRLTLQKIATFIQFLVYVGTGITCIILSFRLNDHVLAVIGGTIAVSVGFAVKDLVASFIAGIMIMIDRPFQVGDRVSFGDQYGDITSIGLRSVRMQTLDDNTVTIPNNKFLNDITSNGNYGALDMLVVLDFYVGIDQDVVRAREILHEAAVSSRYVHLPKPVGVGISQMITDNYVAVRLRVTAYVLDTRYEKAFETDVHLRAMQAMREANILPPTILHRTLDPDRPFYPSKKTKAIDPLALPRLPSN